MAVHAELRGRPDGPDICYTGHVRIACQFARRMNASKQIVCRACRIERLFGWSLHALNFGGEFLPHRIIHSHRTSPLRRHFKGKAPRPPSCSCGCRPWLALSDFIFFHEPPAFIPVMEFSRRMESLTDKRFFAVAILAWKRNMAEPLVQEISRTIPHLLSDLVEEKTS